MIHTIEIIQPIQYDQIRGLVECVVRKEGECSREDPQRRAKRDLALLTGRLQRDEKTKDLSTGTFQKDVGRVVTYKEFDMAPKYSHECRELSSGIDCFKIERICTKGTLDRGKTQGEIGCQFFIVMVINPRTMRNHKDVNTIRLYKASEEGNAIVAENFQHRMQEIFEGCKGLERLSDFREWNCSRVDYTCDMRFSSKEEFDIFFKLVHKTSWFRRTEKAALEFVPDDKQSEAEKNKSYKILFYDKHREIEKHYKDIEPAKLGMLLGQAQHVVRFEVQCKKPKLRQFKDKYGMPDRKAWRFLREDIARETLLEMYDKAVGDGDFYHAREAEKIIRAKVQRKSTQDHLIQLMKMIARLRRVHEARKEFVKKDSERKEFLHGCDKTFRKRIHDLRSLGIHPVLIPDKCREVKYLQNPKHFITQDGDGTPNC